MWASANFGHGSYLKNYLCFKRWALPELEHEVLDHTMEMKSIVKTFVHKAEKISCFECIVSGLRRHKPNRYNPFRRTSSDWHLIDKNLCFKVPNRCGKYYDLQHFVRESGRRTHSYPFYTPDSPFPDPCNLQAQFVKKKKPFATSPRPTARVPE